MNRREPDQLGNKLDEFLKPMMTGIGGVERQAALSTYLTPCCSVASGTVEPTAARLADSGGRVPGDGAAPTALTR